MFVYILYILYIYMYMFLQRVKLLHTAFVIWFDCILSSLERTLGVNTVAKTVTRKATSSLNSELNHSLANNCVNTDRVLNVQFTHCIIRTMRQHKPQSDVIVHA
jgi:hypothetical protein